MPEQFLAVTRGAGLPVQKAPPPPVAAAVQQSKAAAAPTPAPVAEVFRPPPDRGDLKVAATPAGPSGPGIPMEEGKRKMIVIWGGVAAVILIGGGLAAFFALRSVKPPAPPVPPAPRPINVAPLNMAPVTVVPVNVPPPAPEPEPEPPLPPASDRDTDEDGLTDAEEILLGTDIGLSDSDGDSYSDAQELANLYNPAGVAPQRLLDAGLVYAYEHPTHGWSIYLPRQWSIAATDQEQQELKVTTPATGEEVVIQTGLLPECTTREGGPDLGDEFTTKRGAVGFRTTAATAAAPMVCFRLAADRYVGIEHRTSDPPYRFPHLYEVIIQSFSLPSSSAAE